MAVPAIKLLLRKYNADQVTVVVANVMHKDLIDEIFACRVKCLCRFDGRRFSQVRLLLLIAKCSFKKIYAPLASKKVRNYIFFILTMKNVLLPKLHAFNYLLNIGFSKYSLNSFPGHQVNYLLAFVMEEEVKLTLPSVDFTEVLLFNTMQHREKKMKIKVAIGLSCGLLERHKIPKPYLFAETINKLATTREIEVLVFGTKDDRHLIDEFFSALDFNVAVVEIIDLSVIKAIQELSTCDVGLVGTTGHGHMMAAAGLPLVIFAGVTSPYESGPYVQRAVIISHSYPCGPCYQEAYSMGCKKIPCMDRLDFSAASTALSALVDNPETGLLWREKITKKSPISVSEIRRLLPDIS